MIAILDNQEPSYPTTQENGVASYPTKPTDVKEATVQTTEISATSSDAGDHPIEKAEETPANAGQYPQVNGGLAAPSTQKEEVTVSGEENIAISILKVIESYGVNYEKTGEEWKGLTSFIPTVVEQVKKKEPVRMILPAFPFKSPNARDKVLGVLPDLGEELALYHLNGLCENIARVYGPGADVYISSDGLVYSGELALLKNKT